MNQTSDVDDFKRRFLNRIRKKGRGDDPCWVWTGSVCNGYGFIQVRYRRVSTRRIAYALFKGPPGDRAVKATCGNPLCCNPAHLVLSPNLKGGLPVANKGLTKLLEGM